MTNSLRKLAKDLKAFAKRCKDFKYTEKALFTFLLCGIAGFADVSTPPDQAIQSKRQEISTSIGDMRQEFRKVKAENNKLVKNYNLELIQLMEQGDHVVKSPWSSWQYGVNYFYNDWTGTYKGRGDKTPNVKYKRNSADKFGTYTGGKYGNTALNKKVIEPISAVPVDAAVKPKIPVIKTVGAAEAPVIVTPTLNIQVSPVTPSSTKVPSITPPKVTIPGVTMSPVSGFTLIFPNSHENPNHKIYTDRDNEENVANATTPFIHENSNDTRYISYYQIAGNTAYTNGKATVTLTGNATANNTNGSNFYGGGSRFAYVDDVRRDSSAASAKFTLKNSATVNLVGPAIAGIVNEETSWTDGNTVTNITNIGSINDETENLTGSYTGNLRNSIDDNTGTPKTITANSHSKIGYKVGIAQTTEETIDHTSKTYYELFNGSGTNAAIFNDFNKDFVDKVVANPTTHYIIATSGKSTTLTNGTTLEKNLAQNGVIHFSGDYSTGIQVASVNITSNALYDNYTKVPGQNYSAHSTPDSRSLVRAANKKDGYMQMDGAYSYGMKLAGQALYVDDTDDYGDNSLVSYMANNGLILISGSYDTAKNGSSAGMAKLQEAKWDSKKTIFNNGKIYVAGNNNSGILLESIYDDTVTNNGDITIDRAYNLFDKTDHSYANAYATSNAGIRIQSFKTADLATGDLVGVNNRTINLNNGSGNVGIYAYDVENANDIVRTKGYQILGENASGGTINVGGTNVGMMAQDNSGTNAINFETVIQNSGTINVNGASSIGMYTKDKYSKAKQLAGTIAVSSNNVGVVNNGEFKFTGGTITANGTNSVGVYSANGANSTTEIGDGTANSATLTVRNGGVGLYADAGSTQTLKGLNATVSGTSTAGSILFYNIPSATSGTAGKFDLSNNPGQAEIDNHSYAFYTNNNIFTTGFTTFLNDWQNTGTGTGIALTMKSGSSVLLADLTNAGNKDVSFSNIAPITSLL